MRHRVVGDVGADRWVFETLRTAHEVYAYRWRRPDGTYTDWQIYTDWKEDDR